MNLILFISSFLMSSLFLFSSHPISFVIIIIMQSLILCTSIFSMYNASWFSLIMFLIFMGGLMVLFIYIASLASNEMFMINFKSLSFLMMLFITFIILFLSISSKNEILNHSMNFKLKIYPIFSEMIFSPTLMIMLYLLLTLIISVNIIKLYNAPIRSLI